MNGHGGGQRTDELFRVAMTTGLLTGHYLACQATRTWAGEIAPDRLPPRRIGSHVVAALQRARALLHGAPTRRATQIGAATAAARRTVV